MHNTDQVRSYYDANSQRFASWGPGKTSRSIHREVWGKGVTSAREATWYVDTLIGDSVEKELGVHSSLRVLDLGCGLAGTLSHLAIRFSELSELHGITISPEQVRLGREAVAREGHSSRIQITEADFHDLPQVGPVDIAYAIEAFVHARSASTFFDQVRQVTSVQATLILIDDFLTQLPVTKSEEAIRHQLLTDFSFGWKAPNLVTVQEATELAARHGFILDSETDLTKQLRLRRKRDRFIDALYQLAGKILIRQSYMGGLMGGAALQRAIAKGWIKYSMLVFRKDAR